MIIIDDPFTLTVFAKIYPTQGMHETIDVETGHGDVQCHQHGARTRQVQER